MHVAVLGAGYAGLTLARKLEDTLPPEADLTVVDERDTHLVQHEVHRLLRRPGLADDIQIPFADLLDRATVRQARVEAVDTDAGVATLDDGERLDYDYGAVCLGAETAYYDLPGLREHAVPMKRPADAARVREQFRDAAEAGSVRAVVGGAGLSGIQTAGELAALADDEGVDAEVVLLEQLDAVAPAFPENFQRAVADALLERGVEVRPGTAVERATADAVETDAGTVAYDTLVWTGGIAGPEAMGGERPPVRSDLRVGDHTFVLGDAGKVVDADGEAVPASAQAAIRQAGVVAESITDLAFQDDDGGFAPRPEQYRFDSPGWLVSIGDGAVAQVGPTVLTGRAAAALKTSVGAGYLSSVGAVRNAMDLVREETGMGREE
jgi:NADH dehydrogenase